MSFYDYAVSRSLDAHDYSFAALVMAAMRKADSGNAAILRRAYPELWAELEERYHAPGGRLESDEN